MNEDEFHVAFDRPGSLQGRPADVNGLIALSCRPMSDDDPGVLPEPPGELSPKQIRRLERLIETRPLEPWERYRALVDVFDSYTDLLEQADRKTRFALIIMGLLNAVNFLLVARTDVLGVSTASIGTALAIYAALYAFLSLYFFSQAIEALRPRGAKFFRDASLGGASTEERRLRALAHVAKQSPEDYYDFWREASLDQLCREVAFAAQSMAVLNTEKYSVLERVYRGLIALTALTALLLTALAYTGLHR
jgi:hypothetical protein